MKKTTSKVFLLAATYSLFMSIGIAFIIMQLYSGSFAESFGLSMTELGTLLSCQFLASMITPLITGRLSDVIGKKKVLIGGIALFAIGCFVISLSKTAAVCKIGIFLWAVEEPVQTVSAVRHWSMSSPKKHRAILR
ncbi:MAG: MFS transporter [Clostridiales bacterium]|nr:MFS transporter [Clostridiales bacterium]